MSIITTSANEIMAPIHNRMPVILDSNFLRLWLSEEQSGLKELQEGLNPFPSEKMIACKVSTLVNNPSNDGEELIKEIDAIQK